LPNAHGGGIITMTTHFFSQVRQESEGCAGAASSRKHKIYCKKCLDSRIFVITNEDKEAKILDQHEIVHNQNQIETYHTS
jgi:hypothetical protein